MHVTAPALPGRGRNVPDPCTRSKGSTDPATGGALRVRTVHAVQGMSGPGGRLARYRHRVQGPAGSLHGVEGSGEVSGKVGDGDRPRGRGARLGWGGGALRGAARTGGLAGNDPDLGTERGRDGGDRAQFRVDLGGEQSSHDRVVPPDLPRKLRLRHARLEPERLELTHDVVYLGELAARALVLCAELRVLHPRGRLPSVVARVQHRLVRSTYVTLTVARIGRFVKST